MSDKATVFARIDPYLKEEAEDILSRLGITVSGAIQMYYRQIVLKQGIPFELSVSKREPESNRSPEDSGVYIEFGK